MSICWKARSRRPLLFVGAQTQGGSDSKRRSPDAREPIWEWLSHYDRFWTGKLKDLKELIERRKKS
jgi:hypothetical protein